MKILCIGDIVGRPGRRAVRELLPKIKEKHKIDLVLANGENAAGGVGLTRKVTEELLSYGIEIITLGNHTWDNREIFKFIDDDQLPLVRPANYPPKTPGKGYRIFEYEEARIGIINMLGRVFLGDFDCPFRTFDQIYEKIKDETDFILVDFHAEATAEKMAFGWYLDGRATAVFGTHTHIQTADERILPGGTGYITDLGMTGPIDSVIGVKKDVVIEKFLTQLPKQFEVAKGDVQLCGIILDITEVSGKVRDIQRIQENSYND
ncbi:metallophosphoesterase [Anoxybacter fermentans]|uniref:Metallophosphoesterase n=1 Tax=Anoxybacter fermentans TaxID=1323375 RepID=A0A3Q9HP91_9FIRM|nr:TIGR00282 family metallophosphoesterase [Anoxybacter fermentans]AZR72580.1 metallophosphoesterase [Anoxybacter fermentans]